MVKQTVNVDGKDYEVVHSFSENRCLVNYDGLFVLVDQNSMGEWDLSGEPANAEEKVVIADATASMNDVSILKITKE